nr:hypothetical protein [Chlamydiota bacterium]
NPELRKALFYEMSDDPEKVVMWTNLLSEHAPELSADDITIARAAIRSWRNGKDFKMASFMRALQVRREPLPGEDRAVWLKKLAIAASVLSPDDADRNYQYRMESPLLVIGNGEMSTYFHEFAQLFPEAEYAALRGVFDDAINTRSCLKQPQFTTVYNALAGVEESKRLQTFKNIVDLSPSFRGIEEIVAVVNAQEGVQHRMLLSVPRTDMRLFAEIAKASATWPAEYNHDCVSSVAVLAQTLGWIEHATLLKFCSEHRNLDHSTLSRLGPLAQTLQNRLSLGLEDALSMALYCPQGQERAFTALMEALPNQEKSLGAKVARSGLLSLRLEQQIELIAQLSQLPQQDQLPLFAKDVETLRRLAADEEILFVTLGKEQEAIEIMERYNMSAATVWTLFTLPDAARGECLHYLGDMTNRDRWIAILGQLDPSEVLRAVNYIRGLNPVERDGNLQVAESIGVASLRSRLMERSSDSSSRRAFAIKRGEAVLPQLMPYLMGLGGHKMRIFYEGEPGVDVGGLSRDALQSCSDELPDYFSDILHSSSGTMQIKEGADPTKVDQLGTLMQQMAQNGIALPRGYRIPEGAGKFTAEELSRNSIQEMIEYSDKKELYQRLIGNVPEQITDEMLPDYLEEREGDFRLAQQLFKKRIDVTLLNGTDTLRKDVLSNLNIQADVDTKAARYLRNWIKKAPQERLEKFVQLVSGSKTLPAGKTILVTKAAKVNFFAHSCAFQIELGKVKNESLWNIGFEAMLDDQSYTEL